MLLLGASATEIGISKVKPATTGCNYIEIWLDASAKDYEYLGFFLSDAEVNSFPTPVYIDNVEVERLFRYDFSIGCGGFCLDFNQIIFN